MSADWSNRKFPKWSSTTDIDDASAYELDKVENNDNITSETNLEGSLNATLPITTANSALELKAGVKGRRRTKMRDESFEEYGWNGDDDVTMDMVAGDYANPEYLLGNYPNSARNFQDPQQMRDHFSDNESFYELEDEVDLIEDTWAADYEATENVGAGFLQAKISSGIFSALAGLRLEYTGAHYQGYNVDVARAQDLSDPTDAVTKVDGYKKTVEPMPIVHLKLSPLDNLNLRAAYGKTFARPDFYSFVPYRLINDDGDEIELGNSDLNNTHAHNIDFMAEYYFKSLGVFSAGFFMKSLQGFIYERVWEVVYEEDTPNEYAIEYVQPVNGNNAQLLGIEVNFEKQLTFLPSFLNGFGLGGNYTWTTSEADVITNEDDGSRSITLPGQSEHVLNGYLQYEKYGVSARVALNYNSDFIDEVGSDAEDDSYYEDHMQLDLSLSYTLPLEKRNLVVFADFVNLTDEPLQYYSMIDGEKIPLQQEYYSWWCSFGVKFSF
jgi:TonB-dependent receptor